MGRGGKKQGGEKRLMVGLKWIIALKINGGQRLLGTTSGKRVVASGNSEDPRSEMLGTIRGARREGGSEDSRHNDRRTAGEKLDAKKLKRGRGEVFSRSCDLEWRGKTPGYEKPRRTEAPSAKDVDPTRSKEGCNHPAKY